MIEMLAFDFMQRALAAGLLIGILSALVGFFVVLMRMSFTGVGISHSAFGGIALGVWWQLPLDLSASVFAVLMALLIGYTSRRGKVSEDTSIGIIFSFAMALGVVVVSLFTQSYVDLFSYLFGNILTITAADLYLLAAVTVAAVLLFIIFFKRLLFMAFDPLAAEAAGIPVPLLYYGLLTFLAVTIVVTVKVVGVVLASAMLVLPAATGRKLADNYRGMIIISLLAGPVSVLAGLIASYYFNLPPGAAIVITATALFLLSLCFPRPLQQS